MEKPLGGMIQFDEFNAETYNTMYIAREVDNKIYRPKQNAFIQEYMSYILDAPLLGKFWVMEL